MQKYRAATAGDSWRAVVIDLDDKIVEMIVALEPVTALAAIPPHRLIVMAAPRIFAPGVLGPDGTNRQKGTGARMAVGAPPQLARPEGAFWGAAIAFTLVGPDTAAPKGDGNELPARGQPASARIARRARNPDRGKRPITRTCLISA
jgi:hypothetical protein